MSNMSIANVTTGTIVRPIRAVLYGVEGVGKTTFGAGWPAPIFMASEDGTHHVDVARFPQPKTWDDVLDGLSSLFSEDHDFETLVIDSVDWCQLLAADAVCKDNEVAVLEDIPFGKWKGLLLAKLRVFLTALDAIHQSRKMHLLLIAHSEIRRFSDPETDDYDRYSIKALPAFAAMLREWCDVLAFTNFDRRVKSKENAFAQAKAQSFAKREMYFRHSAAYDAKSRYPHPDRLPLDWSAFFAAAYPEAATAAPTEKETTE